MMKLLAPTSQAIQSIQTFREKNRTSPLFNHLSAISESIPALGWVTVVRSLPHLFICIHLNCFFFLLKSPAPGPYIKEMNDAGQFYTNRVLKDWKDKLVLTQFRFHMQLLTCFIVLLFRDKTHVDWVRAWIQVLTELQAYVKKHHTTGLVWNAKGLPYSPHFFKTLLQ